MSIQTPIVEVAISGFDWDAGNQGKCAKHGVSASEVEELFAGTPAVQPDPTHSTSEERFQAIGSTAAGRYVFLVFTIRSRGDERVIRPISARYMHRKEIARYEQDNPDLRH